MSGVWLLWKSSGSFGGTGHGGIDIDLEYCWAVAGVGGFGYALAVRLFRSCPVVRRVREFWYMEGRHVRNGR